MEIFAIIRLIKIIFALVVIIALTIALCKAARKRRDNRQEMIHDLLNKDKDIEK